MTQQRFTAALRAEIEGLVARYEAMATAHEEALAAARSREADGLRAEIAALREELGRERREGAAARSALEAQLKAATATASALEEQFDAERRFVGACVGIDGSLLHEAIAAALGSALTPGAGTFAALKAKGVERVLTAAIKDRGRSVVQAPLLASERAVLPALAAAAGCELIVPVPGTRFASTAMDKAGTAADPAEEGNVLDCAMPGARLAGSEGALVFPRVVVATG